SPAPVRDAVIADLVRWRGRRADDRRAPCRMTPDEILALASRDGCAIGAHSARHLMLPRQPIDVQREEVEHSRRTLEAMIGRPIRAFAYPFGAVSSETAGVVASASFDLAVTCEDALLTPSASPLLVPRLDVNARPTRDFAEWLRARIGSTAQA